jgi:hypothetical protein
MSEQSLYGQPAVAATLDEYEAPDEYSGQGDSRIVRDLLFSYMSEVKDPSGNSVLEPVNVPRGTELTLAQMGLMAQEKGERNHSFYTDDEREVLESGGNPEATPTGSEGGVSEMGEYELAEYIGGSNPTGKPLNVDDTIALAGDDKDLAHRILQAENVATDGDPRKGVEVGLTAIIEG